MDKKTNAKRRITISVPTNIVQWIDEQIKQERFGDYSHAFRYGIICAQREDELKHKIEELEKIIEDYERASSR